MNSRITNDRTRQLDSPKGDKEAQPRDDGCKVYILERRGGHEERNEAGEYAPAEGREEEYEFNEEIYERPSVRSLRTTGWRLTIAHAIILGHESASLGSTCRKVLPYESSIREDPTSVHLHDARYSSQHRREDHERVQACR